jgi:hypothetical protein
MSLLLEDPRELTVISELLNSQIQDIQKRDRLLRSRYSEEYVREFFRPEQDLEMLTRLRDRVDAERKRE